jgi:hypothetical protein
VEPQELSWNNLAQDTRPLLTHLGPMTIKVTLHDGMLVTNPEQFTDEREEYDIKLFGRYHDLLTFKPQSKEKSIMVDILMAQVDHL